MLTASLLISAVLSATVPVRPDAPHRFVAETDSLLHASLYRPYHAVPGNLEIVEIRDSQAVEWRGEVVSFTPERTQTHPGVVSFRAGRVVKGREYEVRVSEPGDLDLSLRPEGAPGGALDARRAVAAGMSWLVRAADAWLSNQPRLGAIAAEGQIQHAESRACIACHITQFSTRAYMTATSNGYAVAESHALERIMQRLRENPRPLPGHDGVNWSRVIYSARTVSSRLPVLYSMHRQLTRTAIAPDRELILGAARFLALADDCGAGRLHAEADGARPDVSAFEIGWQSWKTFGLAAQLEPANAAWTQRRNCAAGLLASQRPENTIDAAWQIIALGEMGRPVASAIENVLRQQQSDGRFSLSLDRNAPPSDFVSYHVLYALARAGYRGEPVDRLAAYTLKAQRPDGSWKGSPEFKGFDTPFRDTQFAVMALSELAHGNAPPDFLRPPDVSLAPPDPWRVRDRDALQRSILERMAEPNANGATLVAQLAASMDENLGQLRQWQSAIRDPQAQAAVESAARADSERVASLLAGALREGPRVRKLRVLRALAGITAGEFVRRPRFGNDAEAPQILADPGHKLEDALLDCLDDDDREMVTAAVYASTALSDVATTRLTAAIADVAPSFASETAAAYGEGGRGRLTLTRHRDDGDSFYRSLAGVLSRREPHSLRLLLDALALLDQGEPVTRDYRVVGAMEILLKDSADIAVLRAAAAFPRVLDGPLMRDRVMEAIASTDLRARKAAADIVVDRYLINATVVELSMQFLAASRGQARTMILDSLDPARVRFRADLISAYSPPRVPIPADLSILGAPFVQQFVIASLRDTDALVQAAALDLVRKQPSIQKVPAIQLAARQAAESPSPRNQAAAASVVTPQIQTEPALDFAFFRARVQPLLERKGPDGRSCVMCHASNARFPLRSDVRANFHSVAQKVTLLDPLASAVITKPLLPSVTTDGDVFRTSHNGGERWTEKSGSEEYQTILAWIRGARLTPE